MDTNLDIGNSAAPITVKVHKKPLEIPYSAVLVRQVIMQRGIYGLQLLMSLIARMLMPIFWTKVQTQGIEKLSGISGPVLILANHKSYYDPLVVDRAVPLRSLLRPLRYFSKDQLFIKALSRAFFLKGGAFPSFYGAGMDKSLEIPIRLLQQGETVVMFPEGRCIRDDSLGEARPGVGALVMACPQVTIIPLAMHSTYKMAWKFFRRLPIVKVSWGQPFRLADRPDLAGAGDMRELSAGLMDEVVKLYQKSGNQ